MDWNIAENEKQRLPHPLVPKPYEPKPPPRNKSRRAKKERQFEIERIFDPIHPIREIEARENWGEEGVFKTTGKYYIRWVFSKDLNENLTPKFMRLLRESLKKAFFLRHAYQYNLRNIEDAGEGDESYLDIWRNPKGTSPLIERLKDAENWLWEKEEERLNQDRIKRPNTKWVFDHHMTVELKAIKETKPLLGKGQLPEWLRKQLIVSLDTYGDNLCLWRSIAVYRGAAANRSTKEARRLAKGYGGGESRKIPLDEMEKVETYLNKGKGIEERVGIRVYEPVQEGKEVVWELLRAPPENVKNIITIGKYGDHAFLIKSIEKLGKNYACTHCRARFTQSNNLQRHVKTCAQGKTKVNCPGEKVEAPQTAYEKAFYPKPKTKVSKESIQWLEYAAKKLEIPINHAMSGQGGERWVENAPVDGYNHKKKLVLQYHRCYWHGCRKCYPDREKIIARGGGKTREEKYQATKRRTEQLKKAGYKVIERWACEVRGKKEKLPKPQTKSYPHAILYDFEAYGDKNKRKTPTNHLTIENEHVPISVSIGDTSEEPENGDIPEILKIKNPTHICEKNPAELIRRFMEEVERRGENIRKKVRAEHMPEDIHLLPKEQQKKIEEWCDQVPVVSFNSGQYDLNLIKNYFADHLAAATKKGKVKVAKNGKKIMFITTPGYRFLDIINYLGPGVSYEKWVAAYGCEVGKTWLPYEWFNGPEKLEYRGLPEYRDWYSKLKGDFVLKPEELEKCKKKFKEKGMETFQDWLEYYNNQDVKPGLEALQKMKNFYTEKGIDIMKDVVSIPGVSLHYLIKGAIERGADLYAPNKEAYEMLKAAVVGGPSLVFTRYHEVGKTRIRSHQIAEPKLCQKIQGYDANALYLSTMLREMPCGKERVVNWEGTEHRYVEVDIEIPKRMHQKLEEICPFFFSEEVPADTEQKRREGLKLEKWEVYEPLLKWFKENGAKITKEHQVIEYTPTEIFTAALKEKSWFGFAEIDIEIPKHLHQKFEEMCPFFHSKTVPTKAVPEQMHEYLRKTGRKCGKSKKLLGTLAAEKLLVYAPLLDWYINHGAVITKVYRTIDYTPAKIFPWFVEQVTEARRTGDVEKSKALLADIFKLLGNSGYGKLIEALERQTNVIYTKDEKAVGRYMRSAYFENINEIGEAYELESRKAQITIRRPFQIGIAVYQLAKLRMLEFYYDFLDRYLERKDFELIQMDTDSNYLAISGEKLEDIVRPELKAEFEEEKKNWLAWDKWSGRTPGLFKKEFEGDRMIALCSKCYYADDQGNQKKLSTKGMSKKQNAITWERFKAALEGHKDMATNRGFRMRDGKIVTYKQEKLGLSAYYDKRWVLPDGIHTEPIEYHI